MGKSGAGPRLAYLLLTLTTLFWAGNFVLGRAVHAEVPPLGLSFWRWVGALLIVLPFVIRPMYRDRHLIRRHWRILLVLSVLGVTNFNTFVYLGLQSTSATNSVLIQATNPVQTLLLAALLLGEPLSGRRLLGVACSLCGVAVIVTRADPDVLWNLSFSRGDLWILLAAFDWALYSVCLRWRPPGLSPTSFLGVTFVVGCISLLPLWGWESLAGHPMNWTSSTTWLTLGYVALFPSVLAFLFWNRAVAEIGASRSAQLMYLMPVFGIGLSALFLDERLQTYHGPGVLLVFVGIWLATRPGRAADGS